MHLCTCVCGCSSRYMYVWSPEVDTGCLSLSLSSLFSETGSLTVPGVYHFCLDGLVSEPLGILVSVTYNSSAGIMCCHTGILCVLGIPTQVFMISSSHNSQHYCIQLALSPKYSSHGRVLKLATLPGLHFPVILLYHWKCLFRPTISISFFSYLLAQSLKCGLHCGIFLVP